MQRPTIRLAGRLALASALFLALLTPAAAFAADPVSGPSASASAEASSQPTDPTPSPSASEQGISVDPTFIAPTATPNGAVLGATGRPQHTLPPTDAVAGSSSTSANAQGLPLLLLALATICLVAASLPEVRRR
jgi:hypothetical protein